MNPISSNVATWDRWLRLLLALLGLLLIVLVDLPPTADVSIEVLALAAGATALLRWDPVYAILGRGTRPHPDL